MVKFTEQKETMLKSNAVPSFEKVLLFLGNDINDNSNTIQSEVLK